MPTALRAPETIDDLLVFRLSRILETTGTAIIRLCEGQHGITWREWRIIASLGPDTSLLSSELAVRTHLDRGRTSKAVTTLVAKKLLQRTAVSGDMRKARISLTVAGQELLAELFPVVAAHNARLLQELSDQDLVVLDRALAASQFQAEYMLDVYDYPKSHRRLGGRAVRYQS